MKTGWSIRSRLIWAAGLVLAVFLATAGWAVQQAHADSVLAQRYSRLQTTVYLLLAAAELDANGAIVMPSDLAEPRLTLPRSGLYASIARADGSARWVSGSALGQAPVATPEPALGQWQFTTVTPDGDKSSAIAQAAGFLSVSYTVNWAVGAQQTPLVFTVAEDRVEYDRELKAFTRTLWLWLGATGTLLLITQTLLLHWALTPLGGMALEIERIEQGQQAQLLGRYPKELAGLTRNLNLLIEQERTRQTRYRQALDDLAHSLKTPLAALRATLNEPDALAARVAEQVRRMDDIVVHQLGRAGATGSVLFVPPLHLAPLVQRVNDTLRKVYADKQLTWSLSCADNLTWRISEGDAFEILGNLMDNAAKWARRQAAVAIWIDEAKRLCIRISDDGPGFADPQIVGQRRVRLDEQVPGHGIGLAVVNDLVVSHKGSLQVTRSTLGGAQVDVILPALTAAPGIHP